MRQTRSRTSRDTFTSSNNGLIPPGTSNPTSVISSTTSISLNQPQSSIYLPPPAAHSREPLPTQQQQQHQLPNNDAQYNELKVSGPRLGRHISIYIMDPEILIVDIRSISNMWFLVSVLFIWLLMQEKKY